MPISNIYVYKDNGEHDKLSTSFIIKSQINKPIYGNYINGINVSFDKENNIMSLTAYDDVDSFKDAYNKVSDIEYLTSINSVPPTDDGAFFIFGSACDSVDIIDSGSIRIEDYCQACSSCRSYISLLKAIEYFKILINYFKDYNLYDTSTIQTRKTFLESKRLQLSANCAEDSLDVIEEWGTIPTLSSNVLNKLMHEYVTTVHMWNYAVSMAGSHTQISTAPEDASGFVIQTLRSLPSCDGDLTVSVEINVEGPDKCNDMPVSLFVPDPKIEFLPNNEALNGDIKWDLIVDETAPTKKKIVVHPTTVTGAGSLCVTARFLPLCAVRLFYDGKEITVEDFMDMALSSFTEETETSQGVTEYTRTTIFEISTETYPIINPTKEEYNQARRYPSISVAPHTPLTYTIDLVWTITGKDADKYKDTIISDTYYFNCRPLRKPVADYLWKNVVTVDTSESSDSDGD